MMTHVRFSTQAASKKLGNFWFTPHSPSSHSCINEYLAMDSDGLCERIVHRAVIAAKAECFPEKLNLCLYEQVCQGSYCECFDRSS